MFSRFGWGGGLGRLKGPVVEASMEVMTQRRGES